MQIFTWSAVNPQPEHPSRSQRKTNAVTEYKIFIDFTSCRWICHEHGSCDRSRGPGGSETWSRLMLKSLISHPACHSGWQTDELLAIESLYLFEGYRHHISYSRSAPMLPGFRHFTLQLCTLDLGFCHSYFRVTQKCQRCFHVDIARESSGVWPANMISETAAGLDQLQHIRQGGPQSRSQFLALITWAWLARISTKFSGTTARGVHAQSGPGSGSAVANTVTVKFGSGTSGYMGSAVWQAKRMHLPFWGAIYELKASSQTWWQLLVWPGSPWFLGNAWGHSWALKHLNLKDPSFMNQKNIRCTWSWHLVHNLRVFPNKPFQGLSMRFVNADNLTILFLMSRAKLHSFSHSVI